MAGRGKRGRGGNGRTTSTPTSTSQAAIPARSTVPSVSPSENPRQAQPVKTPPVKPQPVKPRTSTPAAPRKAQPSTSPQPTPVQQQLLPTDLGVRDFPPPQNLFHQATHTGASPSSATRTSPLPHASTPSPRSQPGSSPQPRGSSTHQSRSSISVPSGRLPAQPRTSANPQHSTPTSSGAQNDLLNEFEEEGEEEDDYEEEVDADGDSLGADVQSTLPPDVLEALNKMLVQKGREEFTTLLSPHLEPGTTW